VQNCDINERLIMLYVAVQLLGQIYVLFTKMRSSVHIRQYVRIMAKRVDTNHSKCEDILMSTSRSQELSTFLKGILLCFFTYSTFFSV